MPLPLIPAVGAVIALGGTAIGAKKGYDAYSDSKDAKSTNQTAQDIFDNSQALLDKNREFTNNNIEKFGKFRIKVFKDYLLYYIKIFDKIKNIELEYNTLIDKKFDISLEEFEALKTEVLTMKSLLGGGVASLGAGALAGFGAYGSIGLLATASTGTAISSLGGVAATNATLAWLGGGSLATGGLGMAGGTLVLGGLVAGSDLAVAGWAMASSA